MLTTVLFAVAVAASTLKAARAGADVNPDASVTVYWMSSVPENPAAGVKVTMHVVALTVTVPADAGGSELVTTAQVKGPVPEGSGSAMTTGPEAAGTVVEIGQATGMTCTVAVAGRLAMPSWPVATKVYSTVPEAPGAGVNTIAPVAEFVFTVPDGGAVPIVHVKGPEPVGVVGCRWAAMFTVVVALTSTTAGVTRTVTFAGTAVCA